MKKDKPIDRVLLSAYACNPNSGSEPGVGWQALLAVAEVANSVVVLTRSKNVLPISTGLLPYDSTRIQIVPFELGRFSLWLKRKGWLGTQAYYAFWQLRARAVVRKLHQSQPFDLAYHSTFATDWLPCAVSGVRDLPFVWGPVGGSSFTPLSLWRYLGTAGAISELVRMTFVCLGGLVFGRKIARRSRLVLAQNADVASRLTKASSRLSVLPNVAIEVEELRNETCLQRGFTVVGAGRLLPWKGWALAIRSMRYLPTKYRLVIYGDGPDRNRLETLVRRVGLEGRVILPGEVPREELLREISRARAFISTSLHEAAGWGIAEALTLGVPTIALDLAGPRTLLAGFPSCLSRTRPRSWRLRSRRG